MFRAGQQKSTSQETEIYATYWSIIGIIAVYLMFFFRLGAPERSHLIEYSVLAVFIYKALIERFGQKRKILIPAMLAFIITLIIGTLDECVQIFLPERVFDPVDIFFNGFAAFMAIGASLLLMWARKKVNHRRQKRTKLNHS